MKRIWDIISGKAYTRQMNREKEYLKGVRSLQGDSPTIQSYSALLTPEKFVDEVNCFMMKLDGFRKLKPTDVEAYDVFSANDKTHHSTIYVLKRDYGWFYCKIGDKKIFFAQQGVANVEKATHFRIYTNTCGSYSFFYSCTLKNGKVIALGAYKERQTSTGEFATDPVEDSVKFPTDFEEICL